MKKLQKEDRRGSNARPKPQLRKIKRFLLYRRTISTVHDNATMERGQGRPKNDNEKRGESSKRRATTWVHLQAN